ncbi:unnamed protein product [Lasius platythorax]|uniref:Uncharacterized protein n=1 Tax=Lasius platythorax TaxID=488582 RepID=A0AAV2N0B6_9HYME
MDIVQIHRADNLSCNDNDCLLIKLDGSRSLSVLFGKPTRGRLERFHIAFLKNYGFFNKYCLLHDEPRITFVQVYNAAAKIARPINGHVLPMAILCRMFLNVDDARTSRIRDSARQDALNLLSYSLRHVRQNQVLRLEEVVTLDALVCQHSLTSSMQEMKIFDSDKPCYIRKKVIESNLLIRMTNWQIVFDSLIGPDIQFLSDLNKTEIITHFRTSHIRSIALIARCVRAIYRIVFRTWKKRIVQL